MMDETYSSNDPLRQSQDHVEGGVSVDSQIFNQPASDLMNGNNPEEVTINQPEGGSEKYDQSEQFQRDQAAYDAVHGQELQRHYRNEGLKIARELGNGAEAAAIEAEIRQDLREQVQMLELVPPLDGVPLTQRARSEDLRHFLVTVPDATPAQIRGFFSHEFGAAIYLSDSNTKRPLTENWRAMRVNTNPQVFRELNYVDADGTLDNSPDLFDQALGKLQPSISFVSSAPCRIAQTTERVAGREIQVPHVIEGEGRDNTIVLITPFEEGSQRRTNITLVSGHSDANNTPAFSGYIEDAVVSLDFGSFDGLVTRLQQDPRSYHKLLRLARVDEASSSPDDMAAQLLRFALQANMDGEAFYSTRVDARSIQQQKQEELAYHERLRRLAG